MEKNPLNLKQIFTMESLIFYYELLKTTFINSNSKIRNKFLLVPEIDERMSHKTSYLRAIGPFNNLPNKFKVVNRKTLRTT